MSHDTPLQAFFGNLLADHVLDSQTTIVVDHARRPPLHMLRTPSSNQHRSDEPSNPLLPCPSSRWTSGAAPPSTTSIVKPCIPQRKVSIELSLDISEGEAICNKNNNIKNTMDDSDSTSSSSTSSGSWRRFETMTPPPLPRRWLADETQSSLMKRPERCTYFPDSSSSSTTSTSSSASTSASVPQNLARTRSK